MWQVYLIIGIFVAVAATAVVWKYNSAIERAVAAEQRASVAEQGLKDFAVSYDKLQNDYKRLDKQLADKARADLRIRKELMNVQTQLEEIKRSNAAIKAWADTVVPDPIIELLRIKPDTPADKGTGGSSGAKSPDASDAGPDGGKVTIRPN